MNVISFVFEMYIPSLFRLAVGPLFNVSKLQRIHQLEWMIAMSVSLTA